MALLNDTLKFDPSRGALQAFLFGVARNFLSKQYEANRRYVPNNHALDVDDAVDDIADTGAGPLERLLDNEAAENLRNALQRISPHYRDVLILYEMHDLSYIEIAEICAIDLGTVRSRLSRARAKLRDLLEGEHTLPVERTVQAKASMNMNADLTETPSQLPREARG